MNEENSVRGNISRESILKFVESFYRNGGVKEVEENLREIITFLGECTHRYPRRDLAKRISALYDLYFFFQQLGKYTDEIAQERETQNNPN